MVVAAELLLLLLEESSLVESLATAAFSVTHMQQSWTAKL
jgi:hypothetical protein